MWLCGYILMNLFTTVLNKMLLQTYDLPFPSVMSLWHYTCSAFGAVFMVKVMRITEPTSLTMADQVRLFLFSILFNVNILVSTVSLYLGTPHLPLPLIYHYLYLSIYISMSPSLPFSLLFSLPIFSFSFSLSFILSVQLCLSLFSLSIILVVEL